MCSLALTGFTFKDSSRVTHNNNSVIKELEYVGASLVSSYTHFSLFYAIYLKVTKKPSQVQSSPCQKFLFSSLEYGKSLAISPIDFVQLRNEN